MAFLASWIKGLVLAVIMATFLDLLLPNNTMRRYVRLVMGLIILVLILSPLLTLSQRDWSIDTLFVEVREVPTDELESLPHIEARADDLVDKQEQWVHETVQRRLEQGIKEGVEQQFAVAVEHISVALVEEGEQPEVSEVYLMIDPHRKSGEEVERIEPIRIDVSRERSETASEHRVPPQSEALSSSLSHEIQAWVAREWSIDRDRIRIASVEKGS